MNKKQYAYFAGSNCALNCPQIKLIKSETMGEAGETAICTWAGSKLKRTEKVNPRMIYEIGFCRCEKCLELSKR